MNDSSPLNDYEILNRIGSGAFSQVYNGRHIPTKCNVAVKIIEFEKLEVDDRIGAIREVAALLQIDHPNIVYLYNFTFSDDKLYLFLEHLSHGTLLDKANHMHGIPEDQAREYFKEIINALYYLHHTRGIVHRDLKLQNMMLTRDNHVKLIDFGFCNSSMKSNIFHTFVGTPGFTAPEIIDSNSQGYTESCDIFSLGACLYSMVLGRRPFELQNKNKQLLIDQIESLNFSDEKKTYSPELQDLIRGMLCANPDQRITLDQIFACSWLRSCSKPSSGLQSMVDLRRFTTKESLQLISRKNILKPNMCAINALKNFGCYSTEKVATELRRGRITDGTAAYLMMMSTLPPDELNKEEIPCPETTISHPISKKMSPQLKMPTSSPPTKKYSMQRKRKSDHSYPKCSKSTPT